MLCFRCSIERNDSRFVVMQQLQSSPRLRTRSNSFSRRVHQRSKRPATDSAPATDNKASATQSSQPLQPSLWPPFPADSLSEESFTFPPNARLNLYQESVIEEAKGVILEVSLSLLAEL